MQFNAVLPLRVNVDTRDSDLERVSRGLLPSLICSGTAKNIMSFDVIGPGEDLAIIKSSLNIFSSHFRFRYTSDEAISEKIGLNLQIPGWFKQQIIKIFMVAQSDLEYNLVLDSDVVNLSHLELSDYDKIPYVVVPESAFENWFSESANILGIKLELIPDERRRRMMGVTPEILLRSVTKGVIEVLESRSGYASWPNFLMENSISYVNTWTEYTLYWLWCVNTGADTRYIHDANFYKFIESPEAMMQFLSALDAAHSNYSTFAVLQSTKLDLADCTHVYRKFSHWKSAAPSI